ncbi:mRNA-binding ribosome synthesis protein nop7 [Naganishia onofrii]|uniref:mRNA-binding ribosome synthesis protein nop7 n=1 Tax=Naganishia onofrii TaxID=1851511 RepID=A0ACC2WXA0_9TREE|nr:mRNA-binding ribosome synthesis protein nop7 [Naganishia onofrii]
MAKIKKRGESGAAKNYITRTQALKKLQISLSDFRRLCILKGIYPREPTNKKKANKGSSAPASFYYSKDILYLLHEPLLAKFREHKTFAKKLARALGRGEWALAKGLEERKPLARLDHLVKERYPTFKQALADLNDPLSLLSLFERLPRDPVPGKTQVPTEVTAECGKLLAEWKIWAIRTHALRKVFLSIKGVYYECEVPAGRSGETVNVRWLEPWEFKQTVPADVDFRILLTFLDLYRTLTSFVLFKLYTDENLVYPPQLDVKLDAEGEGIGRFKLAERAPDALAATTVEGEKKITKKDVKKSIRSVAHSSAAAGGMQVDEEEDVLIKDEPAAEEEFTYHPSKHDAEASDPSNAPLPTYTSLLATAPSDGPATAEKGYNIFAPYTFYLSRETSSRTWEFVIRAFGGKIITTPSLNALSTVPEVASQITHILLDRPMDAATMRTLQGTNKWTWVQPQWVADCVNKRTVLPAGEGSGYEPGGTLPPHVSPWDEEGRDDRPWLGTEASAAAAAIEAAASEDEDEEMDTAEAGEELTPALRAAAENPQDSTLVHQAELEAEAAGVDHAAFKKQLAGAAKKGAAASGSKPAAAAGGEEDLRKIMMTGKKQRLYEKMQYSNNERRQESDKLASKRQAIEKRKKKGGK